MSTLFPNPPGGSHEDIEAERLYRKQRLAAGFRLFGKFGFDEGVAGHITARDPGDPTRFWVNPFGMPFSHISVSDLICVDHEGNVVYGDAFVNGAAFARRGGAGRLVLVAPILTIGHGPTGARADARLERPLGAGRD